MLQPRHQALQFGVRIVELAGLGQDARQHRQPRREADELVIELAQCGDDGIGATLLAPDGDQPSGVSERQRVELSGRPTGGLSRQPLADCELADATAIDACSITAPANAIR